MAEKTIEKFLARAAVGKVGNRNCLHKYRSDIECSLEVMMAGLKNDVRRLLQMTFPKLEHRCKLFTETMLRFLMKFPSAKTIRTSEPKEISKALIHAEGKRKRVFFSAEEIIKLARASVASDGVAKELILSEKIETLLYLEEKKERITEALVEACRSI